MEYLNLRQISNRTERNNVQFSGLVIQHYYIRVNLPNSNTQDARKCIQQFSQNISKKQTWDSDVQRVILKRIWGKKGLKMCTNKQPTMDFNGKFSWTRQHTYGLYRSRNH